MVRDVFSFFTLGSFCIKARVRRALTTLSDVSNAAVDDDRYVRFGELLLTQRVSSAPSCRSDGGAPACEIQLSLTFYVQSPEKNGRKIWGNLLRETLKSKSKIEREKRSEIQAKIYEIVLALTCLSPPEPALHCPVVWL